MFSYWQLVILFVFLINRFSIVPFFGHVLSRYPGRNLFSGLLSDIFVFLALSALIQLRELPRFRKHRVWFNAGIIALTIAIVFLVAGNFRYLEHFRSNFRPFHFALLFTSVSAAVGPGLFLSSPPTRLLLTAPWVLALIALGFLALFRRRLAPSEKTPKQFAVAALVAGFLSIGLSLKNGIHPEMKYNPFIAVGKNLLASALNSGVQTATRDQLLGLRNTFQGKRQWRPQAEQQTVLYPLLQDSLPVGTPDEKLRVLKQNIQQYVAKREGKWNVIVVLQESLRADFVSGFGADEWLTPGIASSLQDGVRFTETVATAMGTRYGQVAALCSATGNSNFSIMLSRPRTPLNCLMDIFADKGYETYFFHGSANDFDNQLPFYSFHQVSNIIDARDFPRSTAKTSWGITDHAVLQRTVDDLKARKSDSPFFSVVLSLSFHLPHRLPIDAPESLRPYGDTSENLARYVDFAWTSFYERVRKELPNTVVVFVADHGYIKHSEPVNDVPATYEEVRDFVRIPWAILFPDAPRSFGGAEVSKLTSNVDVAPTLLSLLGMENTPQSFMGYDAFSRTEPVFLNSLEQIFTISQDETGFAIQPLPERVDNLFISLAKDDLFFPAQWLGGGRFAERKR